MAQHKVPAPGAFEALRDLFPGYPQNQSQVLALLKEHDVELRTDDGTLEFVNLTCPREGAAVVGLRYRKQDRTQTEDTFLFERNGTLTKFYRGSIEGALPEYEGTHKATQIWCANDGDPANLVWGIPMAPGVTLAAPFYRRVANR
jgi:hypothetical protein